MERDRSAKLLTWDREALLNSSNVGVRMLYKSENMSVSGGIGRGRKGQDAHFGNSTPTAKTDKAITIRVSSRVISSE